MAATLPPLGVQLSRHSGLTRISAAAVILAAVLAVSGHQQTTQAGPEPEPFEPLSLLPQNVGVGLGTGEVATIAFDQPMDPASVASALHVIPEQPIQLSWSPDGMQLSLRAERLWRTDERYLVIVGGAARRADGSAMTVARRFAFTTQTAPVVSDFQVRIASPAPVDPDAMEAAPAGPGVKLAGTDLTVDPIMPASATAREVSAETSVSVSFSAPMDQPDTMASFVIAPEVSGELTWSGNRLVFNPTERLAPGSRYTVSLTGAHDAAGNPLGGDANFSFVVQPGAQLVRTSPGLGESNVESGSVQMWFSQPMNVGLSDAAIEITDGLTGAVLDGQRTWNASRTQVTFTPMVPFAEGHRIEVYVGDGATDADGNPVAAAWSFTTYAPVVAPQPTVRADTASGGGASAPRPVVPPPAPSGDAAGYALNQINAARAAYGFAPLVLDPAISAVAYAHAYDQALNGYFSHTSLDGRTREDRMRAGGIAFSYGGENQCYLWGQSITGTLDWCHAQFMAEPYPGHWNHIGNILDARFTRVGVGIAQVGADVIIVWDFAN